MPTAAHHDPWADAVASKDSANDVDPATDTTDPRFSPRVGNSGSSDPSTGSSRSPASATG
jgi:hypothetical protein